MFSSAHGLKQKFEQLLAGKDPAKRGPHFEKLLAARLHLDGFQVHSNPKAATPRQTDLVARFDSHDYLIEAKWRKKKIDVDDIASLRDRLRRTPPDFIGCIFSMSDYTSHARQEVERDRTREILLFNAAEINAIFGSRLSTSDLLAKKRKALRIDASVLFATIDATHPDTTFPRPRRFLHQGSRTVSSVSVPSRGEDTAFLLNSPDLGLSDTAALLELRLDIATVAELRAILDLLQRTLGRAYGRAPNNIRTSS